MADNKRKSQPEKTDDDQYYDTFYDGSGDQQKEKRSTEESSAMTNTKKEISAGEVNAVTNNQTGKEEEMHDQSKTLLATASSPSNASERNIGVFFGTVNNGALHFSGSSSDGMKICTDSKKSTATHQTNTSDLRGVTNNQTEQAEEMFDQSESPNNQLRNNGFPFGEIQGGSHLSLYRTGGYICGRDARANNATHQNSTRETERDNKRQQLQRRTNNIAIIDKNLVQGEQENDKSFRQREEMVTSSRFHSSERKSGFSFGRANPDGSHEGHYSSTRYNFDTGSERSITTNPTAFQEERRDANYDNVNGSGSGGAGGGDDGSGGEDVFRRVFGPKILLFNVRSRARFNNINAAGLTLTPMDIERFIRFFSIVGFRFIMVYSDTFYFADDNRSETEVVEVLNCIKYRLRSLCFARFYGEEIISPNDLVVSFGLSNVNGTSGAFMFI